MADDQETRAGLIRKLFGAANRTPSHDIIDGYLTTLKRMETASLARLVERILEDLEKAADSEPFRVPTAKELWVIRRGHTRLPSAPAAPELSPWKGDGWDVNANMLLLAYVTAAHTGRAARMAPDSANPSNPGPLTRARTAVFVKWKDAWARDMREDREAGGTLDGKASWIACMASAEAELERLSASERVAA